MTNKHLKRGLTSLSLGKCKFQLLRCPLTPARTAITKKTNCKGRPRGKRNPCSLFAKLACAAIQEISREVPKNPRIELHHSATELCRHAYICVFVAALCTVQEIEQHNSSTCRWVTKIWYIIYTGILYSNKNQITAFPRE